MNTIKRFTGWMMLVAFSLTVFSCGKENAPDSRYDSEYGLDSVSWEEWPQTDCSTSTRPLRDIIAYNLLGIPYEWGIDWMGMKTYIIYPDYSRLDFSESEFATAYLQYLSKNPCSGTHGAYMNLIEGKTDVIIASRDISRNEKASSTASGVEIETAPLAIDALVFIVNPKNPVKQLTSDQIRKIYTGEITNWKEVGGVDHQITPYIRDADSGSQEKMETLVMNGLTMIDGTRMPEIIGSQMTSPYMQLEGNEYGIAYTPFFYCTAMVRDLMNVRMVSIDGVAPSKETLRENKYPFVSSIYAAVRKTQDPDSMAYKLYKFLFTTKGADMIDESGYIATRRQ